MKEIIFFPVNSSKGFDHSTLFIDSEHSHWLLSHTHSAYLELMVSTHNTYLVIKHLESKHTVDLLLLAPSRILSFHIDW